MMWKQTAKETIEDTEFAIGEAANRHALVVTQFRNNVCVEICCQECGGIRDFAV